MVLCKQKQNYVRTSVSYLINIMYVCIYTLYIGKGKGKAVPLQARRGPEGSRKLKFPDFVTTAQDVGKFVSCTHRPPLPLGNIMVLISVRG